MYYPIVIINFACGETQKIFEGKISLKLDHGMQKVARRKLKELNEAQKLQDLRALPGNRLEILRGDRRGQCSIRINEQWRICFDWTDRGPKDVEIVDYH